ncbi:type III secretion system inner membrane ring lipoprotein SctJ [Mixta sp. BE291]|uniref:type III secretion system inner membrane ring lipoprotein SctJ n=1 Tax=Mixta sp. BE291 TaxID=3158787 RepID=UPI00332C5B73
MKIVKVFLFFSVFFLTGCRMELLLTGLDQVQANEVVALLQKNNIKAEKNSVAKVGYSVSVARNDFATAVDLIEIYNLPSKPRVEIAEMFPADALISSPRAEVARIYSAIEQRLEQTLDQIAEVVSSRVHVSYDMSNTDAHKDNKPVHVSALLKVKGEAFSETNLIADVKRLLRNSFNKLEYEDISVVLTPAPEIQQVAPLAIKGKDSVVTPLFIILMACLVALLLSAAAFIYFRKKTKK